MPYHRSRSRHPRRRFVRNTRYRSRVPGLATRPRVMPRSLARKRWYQVATKTFWFKDNGTIQNSTTGAYYRAFLTQNLVTDTPPGFEDLCKLYDEFKVIGMFVKLFPANVGIESDTAIFANTGLQRGDAIVYSDQRADVVPLQPNSIADKINQASARMINPRRPYSRKIFRSTGNPDWGGCESITQQPDQWVGGIYIFGQNTTTFTPPQASRTLWYWTRTYKIVVRGRIQP